MGLQVDPKELKKRQFFLEGNIPKAVLSVCLPMALFQLINELFRVFDLVITSQINPESVSAVSFFNQLNNSIVSVGTGLSIGAGILIAGLYGAGEYERLKTTVNTTFFMAGAAALVLVAGLILGARPILRLANTPAQLVEIGLNYYRITALNLVFTFFNNVYIAIEKAPWEWFQDHADQLCNGTYQVLVFRLFCSGTPPRDCHDRSGHPTFQPGGNSNRPL